MLLGKAVASPYIFSAINSSLPVPTAATEKYVTKHVSVREQVTRLTAIPHMAFSKDTALTLASEAVRYTPSISPQVPVTSACFLTIKHDVWPITVS